MPWTKVTSRERVVVRPHYFITDLDLTCSQSMQDIQPTIAGSSTRPEKATSSRRPLPLEPRLQQAHSAQTAIKSEEDPLAAFYDQARAEQDEDVSRSRDHL